MMSIRKRAGLVAAAAAGLAACATDGASESRQRFAAGTYACGGASLPGATLVVSPDGAYEVRWHDTQDRRATGWLEESNGELRPTSGPLAGAVGRRSADGLVFSGGGGTEPAVTDCKVAG